MRVRLAARPRRVIVALLVGVVALLAAQALILLAVSSRLRSVAKARGLEASWTALDLEPPLRLSLRGLALTRAGADTVLRVDSLRVGIDPLSLLILHPRPSSVEIAHARYVRAQAAADPDTLAPSAEAGPPAADRAQRLRHNAQDLVAALLLPARKLPRLRLRDLGFAAEDGDGAQLRIAWLDLATARGGVRLAGAGSLALERDVPFVFDLRYGHDDRLTGGARFGVSGAPGDTLAPLLITVNGRVSQDRRAGVLRIADATRFTVGRLPFTLGGTLEREGPRARFALAAHRLTAQLWKKSLPPPVLGPLEDLAVRGDYDYHVSLDLDLAHPDSVAFNADVIPHGLSLDLERTRLNIGALQEPFVAQIHLPKGRLAVRDLSEANEHFLPLDRMDSLLVHAVVTNEDGGFFRHRGFNTEAVRNSIAENVKAGAFRRGAGTITMQLARNLWLGHARTLSRKGQEVVLAWVLENLTYLDKRRLLEIYLNIIEWGPGVHGADEAAEYYFGHGAGRMSIDEALFLTTVVPAPAKWRYRLDAAGELRPFERAQMHFIGRAMIAKGWLRAEDLPPAESLRVEIRGPARGLIEPAPADSVAADSAPGAGHDGREPA